MTNLFMTSNPSIFGVPLTPTTNQGAREKLESVLNTDGFQFWTTPNPEILLKGEADAEYKNILKNADIALPDGVGLQWATTFLVQKKGPWWIDIWIFLFTYLELVFAAKRLRRILPERVMGSEFFYTMCDVANQKHVTVHILAGNNLEEAGRMKERLGQLYPDMHISDVYPGWAFDQADDQVMLDDIQHYKPDLLIVCFGAPKQEKWIHTYRAELAEAGVRMAIGLGGTMDFMLGTRKRAPKWMSNAGLEWLYRLFQSEKGRIDKQSRWVRVRRILSAVFVFPYRVFRTRNN